MLKRSLARLFAVTTLLFAASSLSASPAYCALWRGCGETGECNTECMSVFCVPGAGPWELCECVFGTGGCRTVECPPG